MANKTLRDHRTDPYDVHPSVAMVRSVIANMKAKTGRSLEEWVRYVKSEGPSTDEKRRDRLKKHGLGTNHAGWIAARVAGRGSEDGDPKAYLKAAAGYVDAMFAGGKAGLRPIFDELVRSVAP